MNKGLIFKDLFTCKKRLTFKNFEKEIKSIYRIN